jgi:hypothetical protein
MAVAAGNSGVRRQSHAKLTPEAMLVAHLLILTTHVRDLTD